MPVDGRCRKVQTLSLVLVKLQFARVYIIIKEVNSIRTRSSYPSDKNHKKSYKKKVSQNVSK